MLKPTELEVPVRVMGFEPGEGGGGAVGLMGELGPRARRSADAGGSIERDLGFVLETGARAGGWTGSSGRGSGTGWWRGGTSEVDSEERVEVDLERLTTREGGAGAGEDGVEAIERSELPDSLLERPIAVPPVVPAT